MSRFLISRPVPNHKALSLKRATLFVPRCSKVRLIRRNLKAIEIFVEQNTSEEVEHNEKSMAKKLADSIGVAMGPISLTFSDDFNDAHREADQVVEEGDRGKRIHSMTTAEWREKYEKDGTVDLWVEEEYNAGSRLVVSPSILLQADHSGLKGGRDVHLGRGYGVGTGEGKSWGNAAKHRVRIYNRYVDQVVEVEVPEDRYVLWEAEDKGLQLPYACRMGCCTACAVRVLEGEMYQPQALGISPKLREQGYALMCVGYPRSDLVIETVDEDEVYDLQFGRHFAEHALNKNGERVVRDDFALELADMDE